MVDSLAIANPFVFRLYPRLNVAVLNVGIRNDTRYSTMGVLPVPPTARFPTQMIGKLNAEDFLMFLSNNQFLIQIIMPYKNEIGKSRYLKLLSNIIYLKIRNCRFYPG